MIDLSYTYSFQQERFKYFMNEKLEKKDKLLVEKYDNAYIIPCTHSNKSFGNGGILDNDKKPVILSYMYWFNLNKPVFGEPKINNEKIDFLKGTYLYLGYISTHWGHMICDFSTRLYALKDYPDAIPLFCIDQDCKKKYLSDNNKRFLELSGLDLSKVTFINNPIQVEHIIVPQQSYVQGVYYSDRYLEIFDDIVSNIKPSTNLTYDHIYFSRSKLNIKNREIGHNILDELFNNLGFKIIYPECETVDNQIWFIRNAKEYACVQGTLVHNLIFSKFGKLHLYLINRCYLMLSQIFDSINISKSKVTFLDFYVSMLPVRIFSGPFIFIANEYMQKFITDKNIKIKKNELFTYDSSLKYLLVFEQQYWKNKLNKNIEAFVSSDPYSGSYFPPEFLQLYVNKWGMDLRKKFPILLEDPSNILSELNYFRDIFSNILHNFIIEYRIHIKNKGWIDKCYNNMIAGDIISDLWIEAIEINSYPDKLQVFYQVLNMSGEWSQIFANGAMAGSTGKSCSLKGIRIWVSHKDKPKISIFYRVYNNHTWTAWAKNGESIILDNYFQAIQINIQNYE